MTRLRSYARRLSYLGTRSRRMATYTVWEVLLSAGGEYVPQPPGRHRPAVA